MMLRFAAAVIFIFIGNACRGALPYEITTSALTGDVIEGETLTNFSRFVAPSILSNGNTIFTVNTSSGEQAIVAEQKIAFLTGSQVGGAAAGVLFNFLGKAVVNENGEIVMSAIFKGTPIDSTNDSGVVIYNGSTVSMILQKGDPAPETSDTFGNIGGLGHSNNGYLVFSTNLTNSNENAIYFGNGQTLNLLDRTGTMTGDDKLIATSGPSISDVLDPIGDVLAIALWTRVYVDQITLAERTEAVFSAGLPSAAVLWETGDSGFGLPPNTTTTSMFVPGLLDHDGNSNDAFPAFVDYEGETNGRSVHVFNFDLNGPSVTGGRSVAKTGDPVPQLFTFEFAIFSTYVANTAGNVAGLFDAVPRSDETSPGPQEGLAPVQGVWFEDSSGILQLGGHNGQQAPGLAAEVTLQQISFPAFNALNQVAFSSKLAGPGVEGSVNDEAIWATDLGGDLQLVVRTGDLFDVDDDPNVEDLRTINDIGVIASSGGTGGQSTSFNDAGQLALALNFSDFTSGVFVFDLAPPSSPVDLDDDGDVDGADFLLIQRSDPSLIPAWVAAYGNGALSSATAAVPEPSAVTLLLPVMFFALARAKFDDGRQHLHHS